MKRFVLNINKSIWFLFMLMLIGVTHPLQVKAIDNIQQTSMGKTQATISWNPKSYEDSFEVILYDHFSYWEGSRLHWEEDIKHLGSTYANQYTITGLTAGDVYRVCVCSYDSDGDFVEQKEVSVETLPGTAQYYTANSQAGVSLKWSSYYQETKTWNGQISMKTSMKFNLYVDVLEQDTADGYEIELYNEKGKKVKTATMKSKSNAGYQRKAFYKMEGSLYSVRTRAYKTVNGRKVYGKWSAKQYAIRQPVAMSQFSGGKFYVKWEKIPGATGYEVWACRSISGESDEYFRIGKASKSKNMISAKKLNKRAFQKGAVYKYYVVALKKVGAKTYRSAFNYANRVSYK